jgi:hypothetical protein
MPVGIEWAVRTSRFLDHETLRGWVIQHGIRSAQNHTDLDQRGLPDFSRRNAAGGGWRTGYACSANRNGVDQTSCRRASGGENDAFFYPNGMMAYLNMFGQVLAADPSDPDRICSWLPDAYRAQVSALNDMDINFRIWGKNSGQAFGMSAEAVGALSSCP